MLYVATIFFFRSCKKGSLASKQAPSPFFTLRTVLRLNYARKLLRSTVDNVTSLNIQISRLRYLTLEILFFYGKKITLGTSRKTTDLLEDGPCSWRLRWRTWSLMSCPLLILMTCVRTSTPIVEMKAFVELRSSSFSSRHDLPTPLSPTMTSLQEGSDDSLLLPGPPEVLFRPLPELLWEDPKPFLKLILCRIWRNEFESLW